MLWIFYRNEERDGTFANSPDLLKNPVVMWQHKWHKVILIVGDQPCRALIGAMFGDPIARLLWAAMLPLSCTCQTIRRELNSAL